MLSKHYLFIHFIYEDIFVLTFNMLLYAKNNKIHCYISYYLYTHMFLIFLRPELLKKNVVYISFKPHSSEILIKRYCSNKENTGSKCVTQTKKVGIRTELFVLLFKQAKGLQILESDRKAEI